MRTLRILASLAAGLAAAVVSAGAQNLPAPDNEAALYEMAKKEGKVVWYVGMPPDVAKNITDTFTAKYPGVSVENVRLVSVQQFQRFSQESGAGQGIADVLYIDSWSINALRDAGFLAEWVPPGAANLPPTGRVGNFAYIQAYAASAIAYNANKVTPEEAEKLKTWKGIFDPVFKGRWSLSNQICSSCYSPIHMWLDPKMQDEYGEKFMRALAAEKPKIYAEINLAVDRVAAGEDDIVYCCLWGALANARYVKGAPIRWVFPSPTPVVAQSYMTVSKLAPHPAAGRLFMNWWISPDGAMAQQKFFGDGAALKNYQDQMAVVKEPWYKGFTTPYNIEQARWDKNFAGDMALWQKILAESR